MKNLMNYLPDWNKDSPETVTIQEAIQPEITKLWEARDDLLLQLNPWTATWGLDYWENGLGLQSLPQENLAQRRANVAAKLRARETTTPALVREVSETILGVPVTVKEIFSGYRVEICFDAQGELPEGMEALRTQLDQIMPAHLAWDFLITMTPSLYVGGHFTSWCSTALPVLEDEEET
ncbi:MAG TPA: DUF2313 domain-containing protein [Candidatus Enterenecus stercoripullorum]|nr:DUF2313 domain-containing protein [Candidatus Enterenecus stercoripullorum]